MNFIDHIAIDAQSLVPFIKAFATLLIGWIVARIAVRMSRSAMASRIARHQRVLAERLIFWGLMALFGVSALNQLGFQLGVLLGAAGVLTVAIGFASQTSALHHR